MAIIVVGAIVTHYSGIQGRITLWAGEAPVHTFVKTSGPGNDTFPFGISLLDADVELYPGTITPRDYRSRLCIDGRDVDVSMNNVGEYDGWRFYQSGMGPGSSTLLVSHDPWGTGLTYTGYILLGIGMTGFFFQRRTAWRALLTSRKAAAGVCVGIRACGVGRKLYLSMRALTWLLLIYAGFLSGKLWWDSGHVPLSNGPEMMVSMSFAALCGAVCMRSEIMRGALLCVGAVTLSVAVMGGGTQGSGVLMPVLDSPLLSVHVAVVMISYVLFLLMAVLSAVALCSRNRETEASMSRLNRLILVPAVFLLGAGMFIGAVWANQSWGRYWGWDPKETCALVMFLIYSVPMHWASRPLRCFRRPRVLHWYLLLAVLSVLFTYFGANYLLPGLHSYV